MSLSSFDGLLPSTFKKLLAGELPQHRSSHLSEAMAAGCGYPNHAAMLADLRESVPVTFLAVPRLDSDAMGYRLAKIIGATTPDATDAIVDDVHRALVHIHAHVVGDIVPVGNRSKLMPDPSKMSDAAIKNRDGRASSIFQQAAAERGDDNALSDMAMAAALTGSLEQGPIWTSVAKGLIEIIVPVCRSLCGPQPHVSDVMEACSFDSMQGLRDDARLPPRLRHSLQHYLSGIPGYDALAAAHPVSVRRQHAMVADLILHAASELILSRQHIAGWGGMRTEASPIAADGMRLGSRGCKGLMTDLLQALPRHGSLFNTSDAAGWLVHFVLNALQEKEQSETITATRLRLAFCLPQVLEMRERGKSAMDQAVAEHIDFLKESGGNGPTQMLAAHAPIEAMISQALSDDAVLQHWTAEAYRSRTS